MNFFCGVTKSRHKIEDTFLVAYVEKTLPSNCFHLIKDKPFRKQNENDIINPLCLFSAANFYQESDLSHQGRGEQMFTLNISLEMIYF